MKSTLPISWKSVKLGDVAQVNPTKPPTVKDLDSNLEVSFVPMKAVDEYLGKITSQEIRKLKSVSKGYTYFQNNWVLFAKITPCMENGKSAIARDLVNGIGFGSTEFHTIVPSDEIIPEYIYHYLRQEKYRYDAKLSFRGAVGQQRVPPEFIRDTEIPLPKVDEQQKIVDKIEELFSVIGHNTGSLKSTRKTLINLRRKILDHAFKGKLTSEFSDPDFNFDLTLQKLEDSRKKLFSTFKNGRYKQASNKVRKVNSKWLEIPLESFGLVETGATPLRGNSEYWKNGTIPWVTSTVVNQQKVTEASELITDNALKETNTKLFPIGTLLIAMYGEGKTRGKVSELMIEAATNQALAGVILSEEAEQYKEFIKLYLYKNYEDLRRLASGGVQPNLNLTMIKEMQIPFPSKKEQSAIVDILNRYLSIIDNSLTQIDQILAMTNGTKQSILKQAFEGKLA